MRSVTRHGTAHVAEPSSVGDALDALAEVVVAEREREPRVAGRAERLAGHDRDLRLLEQHLAQLERRAAACDRRSRGRARPRTTGSSRTRPRGSRQRTPGISASSSCIVVPAALERGAHLGDGVEVAADGRERGALRDVRDVRRRVRLQVDRGGDDVARADHPADAPSRHRVRLGDAVQDDARSRRARGRAPAST